MKINSILFMLTSLIVGSKYLPDVRTKMGLRLQIQSTVGLALTHYFEFQEGTVFMTTNNVLYFKLGFEEY